MGSYLSSLPSWVSTLKARPQVTMTVSLVFNFGSDVRVCSGGLRLVDPSVFFSRDPKARRAQVGAWLLKKELAVNLVVSLELLQQPTISGAAYGQIGIHQHVGHRLKLDGNVANALGSQLSRPPWSTVCYSWEVDADNSCSVGHVIICLLCIL